MPKKSPLKKVRKPKGKTPKDPAVELERTAHTLEASIGGLEKTTKRLRQTVHELEAADTRIPPKRPPKEDLNKIAYKAVQETIRKSKS
jgi:hypothetical protein